MSATTPFAKPPARLRPLWPYTVRVPDWKAMMRYGLDAAAKMTLSPALQRRAVQTSDTPTKP